MTTHEAGWAHAAGALDGPPSLFGPSASVIGSSGAATIMNRCQLPFGSPSDSTLAALRNQSVA